MYSTIRWRSSNTELCRAFIAAVACSMDANWTKAKRCCISSRTTLPNGSNLRKRSRWEVALGSKLTTKRVSEGVRACLRRSSSRRLIIPSPRAHSTFNGLGAISALLNPSIAEITARPSSSVAMKTKAKLRLRSTRATVPCAANNDSISEVRA